LLDRLACNRGTPAECPLHAEGALSTEVLGSSSAVPIDVEPPSRVAVN